MGGGGKGIYRGGQGKSECLESALQRLLIEFQGTSSVKMAAGSLLSGTAGMKDCDAFGGGKAGPFEILEGGCRDVGYGGPMG